MSESRKVFPQVKYHIPCITCGNIDMIISYSPTYKPCNEHMCELCTNKMMEKYKNINGVVYYNQKE